MTSPTFPTGQWVGFYNYSGHSRKHLMDLILEFKNGTMTGQGADGIGEFLITGHYSQQTLDCAWDKSYIGKHSVKYKGYREGKGIWGTWTLGSTTGGFQIWPFSEGPPLREETEKQTEENSLLVQAGSESVQWSLKIGIVGILALFFLGLAWSHFYPESSAPCLFSLPLFYAISVVLHEITHAVTALITGGKVSKITLGYTSKRSSVPYRFRFLSFDWYVYATPHSGSVHVLFYTEKFYRVRRCLTTVSAGVVNFLVGALAAIPLSTNSSMNPLLFHLGLSWCLVNFWIFLISAIPRGKPEEGSYCDADLILYDLFSTQDRIRQTVLENCLTRDLAIEKEKVKNFPIPELIKLHEATPKNLPLLVILSNTMVKQDHPDTAQYLMQMIDHSETPRVWMANYIDSYLTTGLIRNSIQTMPRVDELSQRLLQLNDCVTNLSTRGSVLVDLGQYEEGSTMLENVLLTSSRDLDKLYAHTFLALAAKHQGKTELAKEHATAAAAIDCNHKILKRITDLLVKPRDSQTSSNQS